MEAPHKKKRMSSFLPWLLLPSAFFLLFTLHSIKPFIFTLHEALMQAPSSFSELDNTTSWSNHSDNIARVTFKNATTVLVPSNPSTTNQNPPITGKAPTILESQFPTGGSKERVCDHSAGKWVWDPRPPLYTNFSCPTMPDIRNCMKYGKNEGHLHWRWKPDQCELSRLEPKAFLSFVRDKKMAFVGDSLARNHVESLLCALSQAETPINIYKDADDKSKTWYFPLHNFTLMVIWSEFLVARTQRIVNGKPSGFNIHLDKIDKSWADKLPELNYVIINNGNWFFRRNHLYEADNLIGSVSCFGEQDVKDLGVRFSVRRVVGTALQFISRCKECKDLVVLLRTFTGSRFEYGYWFNGGLCNRTQPLNVGDESLDELYEDLRQIQLKEMDIVRGRETVGKRRRYGVMDVTKAMAMRVDGHPNSHWTFGTRGNDCLHWCLPGAIDMWNDLLLAAIKES